MYDIFQRYEGNPIVTADAVPRANSIHNSAIVRHGDGYIGIFRVDEIDFNFTLHLGRSSDGIAWDIEPDPIPLETEEGWLLIYHGVWRSCNGYLYYAGGALLDIDEPWKVIRRTRDYLLSPRETYERVGDVPNVVFPSASTLEGDTYRLYYGCADTCIGMAEANLADLIAFIKTNGE